MCKTCAAGEIHAEVSGNLSRVRSASVLTLGGTEAQLEARLECRRWHGTLTANRQ